MDLVEAFGIVIPMLAVFVAFVTWLSNKQDSRTDDKREDFMAIISAQDRLIGRLTQRIASLESRMAELEDENQKLEVLLRGGK